MKNTQERKELVIYEGQGKKLKIDTRFDGETFWLNRAQLAELFNRDIKTIGRHINNALKEELQGIPVVAKYATTASDGKTYQAAYYNLDMILSVGHRVKSSEGIYFRRWANQILKDYLVKGLAANEPRLKELNLLLKILGRSTTPEISGMSSLISNYTEALSLLENYDAHSLPQPAGTEDSWILTYEEARQPIPRYHRPDIPRLWRRGILSYRRGKSRQPAVAILFVYFLRKSHALKKINNNTLAAIVLMLALSKPEERENMVLLIRNFVENK